MRLTNINCPQCNGRLNQQEDKFYCTSCGSAFNIDYDEDDIEYAKLVKDHERTRRLLENNRILLEKNEELRRKFLIGEIKNEVVHKAKFLGIFSLGSAAYAAIIGGISFIAAVGLIAAIVSNTSKKNKAERAQREQERIEVLEDLSAKDIEKDKNFLENAIAGGAACELYYRDEPVTDDTGDGGDAFVVGLPVAVNCYLVKDGSENDLYILYKVTYEFIEDNSLRDVYDFVIFDNIEPDETGHLSSEYSCDRTGESGIDRDWDGYENAEEAIEDVLPKHSDIFEINF